MTTIEIIAEALSIIAMIMATLSFQCKKRIGILVWQSIANVVFAISYVFFGKAMGAIMSALAVVRNITYAFRDKYTWIDSILVVVFFTALSVVGYFLSFYVFKIYDLTVKNYIVECLPIFGSLMAAIAYRMKNATAVRQVMLLSCPLWLTYNVFCFSIGGILNESISMLSIIIAMIRLDRKKKKRHLN